MRIAPSLSACLLAVAALAGAEPAAEPAAQPAEQPSGFDFTDPLGGAAWKHQRLELSAFLDDVEVDGAGGGQRTFGLSGAYTAIAGYQAAGKPFGGIVGLGAAVKAWFVRDDVDAIALAPFAVAQGGGFAELNPRLRLDATVRIGPGFGVVKGEDETDWTNVAYLWGVEAGLTITQGDNTGVGVAVGYESTHIGDLEQDGIYAALRVPF